MDYVLLAMQKKGRIKLGKTSPKSASEDRNLSLLPAVFDQKAATFCNNNDSTDLNFSVIFPATCVADQAWKQISLSFSVTVAWCMLEHVFCKFVCVDLERPSSSCATHSQMFFVCGAGEVSLQMRHFFGWQLSGAHWPVTLKPPPFACA